MWKEFKEFISRGSVIDLAIGIVIGAAFGRVVTSFVNDIVMPPIGMLLGGLNFQDMFISLNGKTYPSLAVAQAAGAPTINYGVFINAVLDFVIVAFVLFLIIRAVNRMRRQPAPAAPTEKNCPFCKTTIPLQASRCPHCTSQLETT
jgi:large conductance mechanosensitive channel